MTLLKDQPQATQFMYKAPSYIAYLLNQPNAYQYTAHAKTSPTQDIHDIGFTVPVCTLMKVPPYNTHNAAKGMYTHRVPAEISCKAAMGVYTDEYTYGHYSQCYNSYVH